MQNWVTGIYGFHCESYVHYNVRKHKNRQNTSKCRKNLCQFDITIKFNLFIQSRTTTKLSRHFSYRACLEFKFNQIHTKCGLHALKVDQTTQVNGEMANSKTTTSRRGVKGRSQWTQQSKNMIGLCTGCGVVVSCGQHRHKNKQITDLSVSSLYVLHVTVWVPFSYSGFLPQSKDTHVRSTGMYEYVLSLQYMFTMLLF